MRRSFASLPVREHERLHQGRRPMSKHQQREASAELNAWMSQCHRVCREHGFEDRVRFERMRRDYGTWRAMVMLVESGDIQSGLTWCHEQGLLDYSIEAAILKFGSEFDDDHVQCAKWRLAQVQKT